MYLRNTIDARTIEAQDEAGNWIQLPDSARWSMRNVPKPFTSWYYGRWQVAATGLFTFVCMYFNCWMQVYAEKRAAVFHTIPRKYNMTQADRDALNTLPDLGFDFLPHLSQSWLADAWVLVFLAVTHLRFLGTPMGVTIFRRWLFCLGALFFLRGISIVVTMLPNPLHTCDPTKTLDSIEEYGYFLSAGRILLGQLVTCSDVLYSGHTVNLTLCALMWNMYSHKQGAALFTCDPAGDACCPDQPAENEAGHLVRTTTTKSFAWVYATSGYVMIIATRFHYSVDVFIGLFMCLFFWKFYHYCTSIDRRTHPLHVTQLWHGISHCRVVLLRGSSTDLRSLYVDTEKSINRLLIWAEKDSEPFSLDDDVGRKWRSSFSSNRSKGPGTPTAHDLADVAAADAGAAAAAAAAGDDAKPKN